MAQIKPFRFHLKKISKAYLQITEGLLEFLPIEAREIFPLRLRQVLHQYLPELRYFLEGIEEVTFQDFYGNLPNPCCVGVLGMEPFQEKGFVEFDPILSFLVIEKLLGGKQEEVSELRPLTETEQGVIEFLMLKLLAQIHQLAGEKAKLHIRLEQMILESPKLRMMQQKDSLMVCLKVHVALWKCSGFLKIFLPHPWALEGFLKDASFDKESFEHKELKANFKRFAFLPMTLWGSLGEAKVSFKDFKNLGEGDVVLFDETGLMHKKGSWQGEVKLLVGNGEQGGLKAQWEGFGEKGSLRLTGSLSGGKIHG